ncbi:MAG: hypothetical protein K6F64_05775 [Clostridia bacterium]|nr:hypothetical protein [Clostridia bacterium]
MRIVKCIYTLLILAVLIFVMAGCSHTCEVCLGSGSVACTNCNEGKVTCTECEGKGYLGCEKCGGTGHIQTDKECPGCKDSKRKGYKYETAMALRDLLQGIKRDENDYWSKCYSCDGTGYVQEDCTDCNGTGVGSDCPICNKTGLIECPECSGTKEVICNACAGKGKVKNQTVNK